MLGLGLGFDNVVSGGGGGSSTPITGLVITMSRSDNYAALVDLGITIDGTGLDVMDDLTFVNADLTGIGDLSAGQYGTGASFGGTTDGQFWNDAPWNDTGTPTHPTSPVYSDGGAGTELKIYVKFASAITSLDKIKIKAASSASFRIYDHDTFSVTDQDGNTLTPTNSPTVPAEIVIYEF